MKNKNIRFTPSTKFNVTLNEEQKDALDEIKSNPLTLLLGKPGSGKTLLACYAALEALRKKEVKEIIITRPMVEVGNKKMGFLPGNYEEKLDPFLYGIKQNFYRLAEKSEIDRAFGYDIKVMPLNLMRSITWLNAFVIIDEIQNATDEEAYTSLTRFGKGTKYVLTGDKSQTDIRNSALDKITDLYGMEGFSIVELYENHRHPIVNSIVERWR